MNSEHKYCQVERCGVLICPHVEAERKKELELAKMAIDRLSIRIHDWAEDLLSGNVSETAVANHMKEVAEALKCAHGAACFTVHTDVKE